MVFCRFLFHHVFLDNHGDSIWHRRSGIQALEGAFRRCIVRRKVMRGLKKAMKWKPDARLVAGMAFAAFVLLMIPLLRIAIYSVPYYDDYKFGGFVKGFLTQERSLRSALQGALYCTKTNWHAWQGTYSASFFNSLMQIGRAHV